MSCNKPRAWETASSRQRLCMSGSVSGSIRNPGADQVAFTSGPLTLDHCNDSPCLREPVEIISSGPVSAEGHLAHYLFRKARHSQSEWDLPAPRTDPFLNSSACKKDQPTSNLMLSAWQAEMPVPSEIFFFFPFHLWLKIIILVCRLADLTKQFSFGMFD